MACKDHCPWHNSRLVVHMHFQHIPSAWPEIQKRSVQAAVHCKDIHTTPQLGWEWLKKKPRQSGNAKRTRNQTSFSFPGLCYTWTKSSNRKSLSPVGYSFSQFWQLEMNLPQDFWDIIHLLCSDWEHNTSSFMTTVEQSHSFFGQHLVLRTQYQLAGALRQLYSSSKQQQTNIINSGCSSRQVPAQVWFKSSIIPDGDDLRTGRWHRRADWRRWLTQRRGRQ